LAWIAWLTSSKAGAMASMASQTSRFKAAAFIGGSLFFEILFLVGPTFHLSGTCLD
jgi:hypothetical protein